MLMLNFPIETSLLTLWCGCRWCCSSAIILSVTPSIRNDAPHVLPLLVHMEAFVVHPRLVVSPKHFFYPACSAGRTYDSIKTDPSVAWI